MRDFHTTAPAPLDGGCPMTLTQALGLFDACSALYEIVVGFQNQPCFSGDPEGNQAGFALERLGSLIAGQMEVAADRLELTPAKSEFEQIERIIAIMRWRRHELTTAAQLPALAETYVTSAFADQERRHA